MYLPTPVRLLLVGVLLYAGTYIALRFTNHVVLYQNKVLLGSWNEGPSLLDASASDRFFHVSKYGGGIFTPLVKVDAAINSSSEFNDKAGTTPVRGELSKKEAESRLVEKPDGWTVVGAWYEHQEKDRHESYHVVLRTSTDPVASDGQLYRLAFKLTGASVPGGPPVVEKLPAPHTVAVHTFGTNSNIFRGAGEDGRWSEVVVDDEQLLACVSWGFAPQQEPDAAQ